MTGSAGSHARGPGGEGSHGEAAGSRNSNGSGGASTVASSAAAATFGCGSAAKAAATAAAGFAGSAPVAGAAAAKEAPAPLPPEELARHTLRLLDSDQDERITRNEFVESIVNIYQQRKSLALTLKDYEAILSKLGYIISGFVLFLLMFIWLWILGQDVMSLGISWVSFLIAFSFLFGSSAQNFCESCIFIFVTRAYDVADRVMFRDDMGNEVNVIVEKVNLLSTVFRRWDSQLLYLANQGMAKREIRNQRRSGPATHAMTVGTRKRSGAA
ncbi:unnamed protein product [Phaeothamnion confervicola]